MQSVIGDLVAALLAAVAVGVAPGFFWARVLFAADGLAQRLAYSIALSITLVPAVALVPVYALGAGVSVWITVLAGLAVAGSGLVAFLIFGGYGDEKRILSAPAPFTPTVLVALTGAVVVMGGAMGGFLPPVAAAVAAAGLLGVGVVMYARSPSQEVEAAEGGQARRLYGILLAGVLAAVALRGYLGPVLFDWPFIRGLDHYSHAVMAELMMTRGEIEPYLIYPPGFHVVTAMISRLTGLMPLEIFPVLAPAYLLLPPLALYALAGRLWGRGYGVAAAFAGGLVLASTYGYFNDAMYPNLITAQFLLVMALCALTGLYRRPSGRSVLGLALLGSSVVLYHPVGSLYTAAIFGLVAIFLLPYLLITERRTGLALLASFALTFVLAVAYAWHTYDVPRALGVLLGGAAAGETGEAVEMAVGTQSPFPLQHMLSQVLTWPVAGLGLLGAGMLAGELWHGRGRPAEAVARATLLLWALVLLVGGMTSLSGFPQRFDRDLGIPLALFAGLVLMTVARTLWLRRAALAPVVAGVAMVALVGLQAGQNFSLEAAPSRNQLMTPEMAEAGEWLRGHNQGGSIMVSPHANQVPSRMMLAMGGYWRLQSFVGAQLGTPRDVPPTGTQPLWDVIYVLEHPGDAKTQRLLDEYDTRYIVIYKDMKDRPVEVPYWYGFEQYPQLYETVFENPDVIIFKPTP